MKAMHLLSRRKYQEIISTTYHVFMFMYHSQMRYSHFQVISFCKYHSHRPQTKLGEGNVFTTVCDSVHRKGSLYRRISVGGVSVQGVLCPGGLCPGGSLSGRTSPRTVKCRRYASYSNVFLFPKYV